MRTVIGIAMVVVGTVAATALTIALLSLKSHEHAQGVARTATTMTPSPVVVTPPVLRCSPRTCPRCHPTIFKVSDEHRLYYDTETINDYWREDVGEGFCDIVAVDYVQYGVSAGENGVNELSFTEQLANTDALGVTTFYPSGEVDIDILGSAESLGYKLDCIVEHELAHAAGYDHSDPIFRDSRTFGIATFFGGPAQSLLDCEQRRR